MMPVIFPESRTSPWAFHSVITLLIIIGAMLTAITWTLFQPPYLSYVDLPFKIQGPKVFYPAQTVPLLVERCSKLNIEVVYSVSRTLHNIATDEKMTFASSSTELLQPGCNKITSMIHVLPAKIEPGIYQIKGFSTVKGPFGDIYVPFYSEPFTVIAIPEPAAK